MKKIRRFPRLAEDYPEMVVKKKRFMGVDVTNGRVPQGYDRLTKRMKRAVKLVINGMTVRDMCDKLHLDSNTWYRWINLHERFKRYYVSYARKQASQVEGRLDSKTGRAVRVIEDALDSPDPYFAAEHAVKLLSGRGLYKKNVESNQKRSGVIIHAHTGKVQHDIIDKDLMMAFIEALTGRALGEAPRKEKVINTKVLKQLPPEIKNGNPEVQKSVEAEII